MPRTIREQTIGHLTVKVNQRLDGEPYETEYAVGVFDEYGCKTFPYSGCWGYGNDLDYINRKFDGIVEDLGGLVEVEEQEQIHA